MARDYIRGPKRLGALDDPVVQSLRNERDFEAAADEIYGVDGDEDGEE